MRCLQIKDIKVLKESNRGLKKIFYEAIIINIPYSSCSTIIIIHKAILSSFKI